jgi:hypothetical protein
MNWSEMRESWNDMRALVQSHWPRLPDVMLRDINGDRAELGRALQRQYGFSESDAEIAISEFEEDVRRPGAVK